MPKPSLKDSPALLRAKHLKEIVDQLHPETPILIALGHGMPNVRLNGSTIIDHCYAGVALQGDETIQTLTLMNCVSKAGDPANIYPDKPVYNTISVTPGAGDVLDQATHGLETQSLKALGES